MLSFEQIKELIELVARHRLGGLELERSGFKLSIASQAGAAPLAAGAAPSATTAVTPSASPVAPAAAAAAPLATAPTPAAGPATGPQHLLSSPIVGTFYLAPAPDAEPFVRVGSRVKRGQVLCIVEAMKLMNEIESDVDGEVVEIYPKNAQPVEYGEPLFAIRTD